MPFISKQSVQSHSFTALNQLTCAAVMLLKRQKRYRSEHIASQGGRFHTRSSHQFCVCMRQEVCASRREMVKISIVIHQPFKVTAVRKHDVRGCAHNLVLWEFASSVHFRDACMRYKETMSTTNGFQNCHCICSIELPKSLAGSHPVLSS